MTKVEKVTAFVCQLSNGGTFRPTNLSKCHVTIAALCGETVESLKAIENQCHRKKCYNLISFCLGVSRVLKKSIDIFCCCGSWGAHTETCKSQIYHSVNVTFWIVCEIATKVLCCHMACQKILLYLSKVCLQTRTSTGQTNSSDTQSFSHSAHC